MQRNTLTENKALSLQAPAEAIQELSEHFELFSLFGGSTFYIELDYLDKDDLECAADILKVDASEIENCILRITEGAFQLKEVEAGIRTNSK